MYICNFVKKKYFIFSSVNTPVVVPFTFIFTFSLLHLQLHTNLSLTQGHPDYSKIYFLSCNIPNIFYSFIQNVQIPSVVKFPRRTENILLTFIAAKLKP